MCVSTLSKGKGGDPMRRQSITFSDTTVDIVQQYADEHSISFTQAVNEIICDALREEEKMDIFLKKLDEHYSKLLTRVRLGVTETDKNVQVIIEILNSMLYFEKKQYGLMPTDVITHETVLEAKEQIKERIARFKQINDEKKRKRQRDNK